MNDIQHKNKILVSRQRERSFSGKFLPNARPLDEEKYQRMIQDYLDNNKVTKV